MIREHIRNYIFKWNLPLYIYGKHIKQNTNWIKTSICNIKFKFKFLINKKNYIFVPIPLAFTMNNHLKIYFEINFYLPLNYKPNFNWMTHKTTTKMYHENVNEATF